MSALGCWLQSRLCLIGLLNSVVEMESSGDLDLTRALPFSDHFQDKKIPVYESLVTQCCPGIGMVVLIE